MGDVCGVSQDQLKSIVDRIERLEEDKSGISKDISDVYAEAKGNGFDVKVLRQVIKMRKMKKSELIEMEELIPIYKDALGMVA